MENYDSFFFFYYIFKIVLKKNLNCSFKQCRSLKFLNKNNKLILLFSYVQKRSFQMCARADVLNQENYVQ